jgi:hypothetical protein
MLNRDETFMGWIQLHERAWGLETYEGRPTLQDMLAAPVLAFWYPVRRDESRFTATIYKDMKDLNAYASFILIHCNTRPPTWRLARLFVDRRRMKVRGARLLVESVE